MTTFAWKTEGTSDVQRVDGAFDAGPRAAVVAQRPVLRTKYRRRSRAVMDSLETAFLRQDLACGIAGCAVCAPLACPTPLLPPGVAPRYVIPTAAGLDTWAEVLEDPEVASALDVILLASTFDRLGSRTLARAWGMLRGAGRVALLHDTHHSGVKFRGRGLAAAVDAAAWLAQHIGYETPVVVLTGTEPSVTAATAPAPRPPLLIPSPPAITRAPAAPAPPPGPAYRPPTAPSTLLQRLLCPSVPPPAVTPPLPRPPIAVATTADDGDAILDALLACGDDSITAGGGITPAFDFLGLSRPVQPTSRMVGTPWPTAAAPSAPPESAVSAADVSESDDYGEEIVFRPPETHTVATTTQFHPAPPHTAWTVPPAALVPSPLPTAAPSPIIFHHMPPPAPTPTPPRGVTIQTGAAFFASHLPPAASAARVRAESITSSLITSSSGGRGRAYPAHLLPGAMDAGLQSGALVRGIMRVSRRDPSAATVTLGGTGGGRVALRGLSARNRALDGDVVVVRLLPAAPVGDGDDDGDNGDDAADDDDAIAVVSGGGGEGGEGAEGEAGGGDDDDGLRGEGDTNRPGVVVGIISSVTSGRDVVAVLAADEETREAAGGRASGARAVVVVPMDRVLPKVRVRVRAPSDLIGRRFVIRIDRWEADSSHPDGRLVRILAPIGDAAGEREAVLVSAGVTTAPFTSAAMACLPITTPGVEWAPTAADLVGRRDVRSEPGTRVLSIDPPRCEDVDDALSVRRMDGGGVEVGVHIADVAAFLAPGSRLDTEAAARGTSVYLVGQRIDMLPALLAADVCSLRAGKPRLAVSAIWSLPPAAVAALESPESMTDTDSHTEAFLSCLHRGPAPWLGRTVITSHGELPYPNAQAVLDGDDDAHGAGTESLTESVSLRRDLRLLLALSRRLRSSRDAAGALAFETRELSFAVGAEGDPTSVTAKPGLAVHGLVAEMMIWANCAVATRTSADFPTTAMLRRHAPPRPAGLAPLLALASSQGVSLDVSSGKALAQSLAAASTAPGADGASSALLAAAAARAMSEAEYVAGVDPRGGPCDHYGLGLERYTHFTSPIRRYADVVAHRQLLAAIGWGAETQVPVSVTRVPESRARLAALAGHLNAKHRAAKRASAECASLCLRLVIASSPRAAPALVTGLEPGGRLRLYVPSLQLHVVTHLVTPGGVVTPPEGGGGSPPGGPWSLTGGVDCGHYTIVESGSRGGVAYVVRPLDRVTVWLSATRSRVRPPALRARIITGSSHPSITAESGGAPTASGAHPRVKLESHAAPALTMTTTSPPVVGGGGGAVVGRAAGGRAIAALPGSTHRPAHSPPPRAAAESVAGIVAAAVHCLARGTASPLMCCRDGMVRGSTGRAAGRHCAIVPLVALDR